MPLELSINHPDFPKGTPFDVGGVLVENGKSVKLDEDAEQSFVARNGRAVRDWVGDSTTVEVKGTAKFSADAVEKMYPAPALANPGNPYVDEVDEPAKADEGGETS